jgi:hypothetical protein
MKVAVVSCWKYRDAWQPFYEFFKLYWPDFDGEVWLITDEYPDGVEVWPGKHVFIAGQISWAGRLQAWIDYTETDVFLLMHEDYFLMNKPETDALKQFESYFKTEPDLGCLRVYPCPGPDISYDRDDRLGIVGIKADYRISCQSAFWRSSYITKILEKVSTSPEFELNGTPLSRIHPEMILSVKRELPRWPFQYYCTAIVQGCWQRGALELCKRHGIRVDLSLRPVNEAAK